MDRRRTLFAFIAALFAATPALCALTASPNPVDFGWLSIKGWSLVVTISADTETVIENITIRDENQRFTLDSYTDHLGNNLPLPLAGPYALPAGASFGIRVSFLPFPLGYPETALTFSGTLEITSEGAEPLTIGLSGTPVDPFGLTHHPGEVNIPRLPRGTTSLPYNVTMINKNFANVISIDTVEIFSGLFGEFQVLNLPDPVPPLAPGERFSFEVVFTGPAESSPLGDMYCGNVCFTYNTDHPWIVCVPFNGFVCTPETSWVPGCAADTGGQ